MKRLLLIGLMSGMLVGQVYCDQEQPKEVQPMSPLVEKVIAMGIPSAVGALGMYIAWTGSEDLTRKLINCGLVTFATMVAVVPVALESRNSVTAA